MHVKLKTVEGCLIGINPTLIVVASQTDYIQSMKKEINLSDHYKRELLSLLWKVSKYSYHKPYRELKRNNILAFANPEESDPLRKMGWNI
jgi:hypothetical protein